MTLSMYVVYVSSVVSQVNVSVWYINLISYPYTYTSDREAHTPTCVRRSILADG